MSDFGIKTGTLATVLAAIDPLTNLTRHAGDFDNNAEPAFTHGLVLFHLQYNTTAPSAGANIADLYIVPEDGAGNFAEGGDGTTGSNFNPQKSNRVHTFEAVDPDTVADEILSVVVPLYPFDNRFVIQNISLQIMDITKMDLIPMRGQSS